MVQKGLWEFVEQGIISPWRMRAVDCNARTIGVSSLQLMESAGKALADLVRDRGGEKILILCGKGNNGGDGLVAARHLQDLDVRVCYVHEPGMSPENSRQLRALTRCTVALHPVVCRDDVLALENLFLEADTCVDALLGTGSSGTLREPLHTMVELANRSSALRISADVPTPGFNADIILAFHRPKVEGSIVAGIGIPLEAECMTGPGDLTILKRRDRDAHKGAGGEVLVIGGGPYQGAPYLAGLGALRAGADIVRIASPVFEPVPDLIYERLDGRIIGESHIERLTGLVKRADVVVMGNGLGDQSHQVVLALAPHCNRAVFDADAIRKPLPEAETAIFTPHAGEFLRMTGHTPPDDLIARGRAVRDAAGRFTILLKGRVDVISDGKRTRFNRTGSPIMTVGGTGDVLAGVTGALFCHLPAFEAACIAAYVNGRAGTALEKAIGGGMLPTDLPGRIPPELYGTGERENG